MNEHIKAKIFKSWYGSEVIKKIPPYLNMYLRNTITYEISSYLINTQRALNSHRHKFGLNLYTVLSHIYYIFYSLPTFIILYHGFTYVYHTLPRLTYLYHILPRLTYLYHTLPRLTYVYHTLPRLTYVYHSLPMFTILYHSLLIITILCHGLHIFTTVYHSLPYFTTVCLP